MFFVTLFLKPVSHYTALARRSSFIQSAVRSQEKYFIFVKMEYSTALSLRSHGEQGVATHCVLSRSYVEFMLEIACNLAALPSRSMRYHGSFIAFIAITRRSHDVVWDYTELLWRSYGAPTGLLSERRGTAFVLYILKTNAIPGGVLYDLTALPWRCLRSYCSHHGVLQFLERRERATIVWQGFNKLERDSK